MLGPSELVRPGQEALELLLEGVLSAMRALTFELMRPRCPIPHPCHLLAFRTLPPPPLIPRANTPCLGSNSLYTLSVQFLNRSAFVKELVEKHHLLEILALCLSATLAPACEAPPNSPGENGEQHMALFSL